jgi:hypothetical protein
MSEIFNMFKQDKAMLFPWLTGSGAGAYAGINPPEYLMTVKTSLVQMQTVGVTDRLIDIGWAVVTTIVVATASFFVTRFWKKLTTKPSS